MATMSILSKTTSTIHSMKTVINVITARQKRIHHLRSPRPFSTSTAPSSDRNYNVATLAVFGGMCLTTFGLGCWQTKRYFEKVELIEKRVEELKSDPLPLQLTTNMAKGEDEDTMTFQRRILKGKYDFTKEVLVGPRGPPIDALASSGPNSGRSSGGMSSGPQGYYVVTPFQLEDTSTAEGNNVVLVNRGWVPISHIQNSIMWNCPEDSQTVVAVKSKMEQPKGLISPPPQSASKSNTKLPQPIFLYYHRPSIEKVANVPTNYQPPFFTATSSLSPSSKTPTFPVAPKEDTVGEYKITPMVHGGYAVTWFGLSSAGIYMTRKLLLRR
mmetsp:Transcript_26543/g.38800  ORF Transcript_26543/g.38800 Transcript_26543/m.38800 type:complete len:327 (+) Transcript_26543:103-1083(+)